MQQRPKVSVLVSAYNMGPSIERAIESVLVQTEQRFEVIVIDDGSTDDTDAVMQRVAPRDERITYVHNAKNQGKAVVVNQMLDMLSGEYVIVLDADDTLPPDSLEIRSRFLDENPHLDLMYASAANYLGGQQVSLKLAEDAGDMATFTRRQLVGVGTYADLLSFMYRAEIFADDGTGGVRMNPAYRRGQDLGMLLDIASRGHTVGMLDAITYNFTMDSHQTMRARVRNRWRTMRSKLDMVSHQDLGMTKRVEYALRVVVVSLAKMAWEVLSRSRDPLGQLSEKVGKGVESAR